MKVSYPFFGVYNAYFAYAYRHVQFLGLVSCIDNTEGSLVYIILVSVVHVYDIYYRYGNKCNNPKFWKVNTAHASFIIVFLPNTIPTSCDDICLALV